MKKIFVLLSANVSMLLAISCSQEKGRYIDLRSGQALKIEKDSAGAYVNADTREPVYMCVDTKKHDTIYGKTGEVINGHVVRDANNVYVYDKDESNENYQARSGDYKKKVDDGEVKIKTDEKKIKKDEDGRKVKDK